MIDENVIKSEIEQGIAQVDNSLVITDFVCEHDKKTRKLLVFFTAENQNNETVEVSVNYGN